MAFFVAAVSVGDKPLEKKKKKKVFVRLDTRKLSSPCTEEIILAPIRQ